MQPNSAQAVSRRSRAAPVTVETPATRHQWRLAEGAVPPPIRPRFPERSAAYLYREQRVVGENEQRMAAGAPKDDIDRTFRHVDPPNLLARMVVDENLSVGHIHIAFAVDGDAFPAALRKGLQIAERAIGVH